jgi:Family of unknown function (DUF6065)
MRKKDAIPDNTFALFVNKFENENAYKDISKLWTTPKRDRDNMFPGSEHCKPFILANQLGYHLTLSYGFNVIWNGGYHPDDLHITYIANEKSDTQSAKVFSNFGNGIITIAMDALIRTPPGINTLVLPPLNYVMLNASALSGTIETDQTNHKFTFNIKIHEPNKVTSFLAGTPLATIIPVPRYYIEGFKIKDGEDVVSQETYANIIDKTVHSEQFRNNNRLNSIIEQREDEHDFHYLRGMDFDETQYLEYQSQSGKRIVRDLPLT